MSLDKNYAIKSAISIAEKIAETTHIVPCAETASDMGDFIETLIKRIIKIDVSSE